MCRRGRSRLGERELELTPKEFDLLALLARNHGAVVSKQQILERGLADDVVRQREDDRRPRRCTAPQARRSGLDRDGARSWPPPPRPGVRRQLLATYLALALAVLAALEIPLGITYARNQKTDLENRIRLDALTIATLAEDGLERNVARPSRSPRRPRRRCVCEEPGRRGRGRGRPGRHLLDTGSRAGRTSRLGPRSRRLSAARRRRAHATRARSGRISCTSPSPSPRAARCTGRSASRIRRPPSTAASVATGSCSPPSPRVVLAVAAVVGLRLSRTVTAPLADLEEADEGGGRRRP